MEDIVAPVERSPGSIERRLTGVLIKSIFLRGRRGGPWSPPPHLPHKPVHFEGNTGARLAGHLFSAADARGTVVLAHPDKRYAKHWFVKEGYVELLLSARYDVLTFDFVGYGESHGPSTYYHEDLLAAARFAKDNARGLPVHVVGVSMGAFAATNASPRLGFVRNLVLESPYPSFNTWYAKGPARWTMELFDRIFPASSRAIQADRNIQRAAPRRILIAYSPEDEVTPASLSQRVANAAPADRTRVLEVKAPHLGFLADERYRETLLATLAA